MLTKKLRKRTERLQQKYKRKIVNPGTEIEKYYLFNFDDGTQQGWVRGGSSPNWCSIGGERSLLYSFYHSPHYSIRPGLGPGGTDVNGMAQIFDFTDLSEDSSIQISWFQGKTYLYDTSAITITIIECPALNQIYYWAGENPPYLSWKQLSRDISVCVGKKVVIYFSKGYGSGNLAMDDIEITVS